MKAYYYIIMAIALVFASCKKDDKHKEAVETDAKPNWVAMPTDEYENSATYILKLSKNGEDITFDNGDELALFVNNECRTLAKFSDDQKSAYLLMKGDENEAEATVMFYSATEQLIYKGAESLKYSVNATEGTADEPKTMSIIR